MLRFVVQLLFCFTAILPSSLAILIGDEHFQDLDGRFWAFYAGGVAIINPETCKVETDIIVDGRGESLPTVGWNDGVYIQYESKEPGVTPDLKGYILINTRTNINNTDEQPASEVFIFDTEARAMVNRVTVGPNVTNAYAVHTNEEVWVHSEVDGYFYVINMKDVTKTPVPTKGRVQGFIGTANTGSLLWDEKGVLGNTGYSSNSGEQFLFNVDLKDVMSRQNLAVNFTLVTKNCTGLNSLAFMASNFHVYAECSSREGGILEFNVDGQVSLIRQHFNVTGQLTELMDGSFVVAVDKEGEMLYMIQPNGNAQPSTIVHNVTVSGKPEYPSLFYYGNQSAEYIACMPLTTFSTANGSTFEEDACDFELTKNESLATVKSLSVAPLNCNPNMTKGGVACIDLGGLVNGKATSATYIQNGGALRTNITGNETSWNVTRRSHKRGRLYDASIANYPQKSLVIVRMDTMEKKCSVQLNGEPYTVVYAPLNATILPGVGPPTSNSASALGVGLSFLIMTLAFLFV